MDTKEQQQRISNNNNNKPIKPADHDQSLREGVPFYEKFADIYDSNSKAYNCFGPKLTAQVLFDCVKDKKSRIIDVCAGTGALAYYLKVAGYQNIDALDGSKNMLKIAENENLYCRYICEMIEANKQCSIPTSTYDVVVTVGSFCPMHMNSRHLEELIRIAKPAGIIIIGSRKVYIDDTEANNNINNNEQWKFDMNRRMEELELIEKKWKFLQRTDFESFNFNLPGVVIVYKKL